MTHWLRLLLVSLCLISSVPIFCQPVFKLPLLNNVPPGGIATQRMSVSDFKNVLSAQFALCWDTTVLRFENISHINMPNLVDTVNFSLNRTRKGILSFAWTSFNIIGGTTLTDHQNVFRINFTAIGPVNSGSIVKFCTRPPTSMEIAQIVNGQTVAWVDSTKIFKDGFVAVGYTVSDKTPVVDQTGVRVAPNPFTDRTRISYTLLASAEVLWYIADPSGRIVLKGNENLPSGEHGMEIARTQLHGAGTYFFVVQAGKNRTVQPFSLF